MKKYRQSIPQATLDSQWEVYTSIFHDVNKQTNIRSSKEEQYQEGFLRELFVKVLGYIINPDANFNLKTELKNLTNNKKADGAIIIDDKVMAVIELKGTDTTDLGKIEAQAFGYKTNQRDCRYVIISNFEKLRFYIDDATEFVEFNLFTLSKEEFTTLWLCLSFESIKNDLPGKLKAESVSNEDKITKELYKDYSAFRKELFHNIVALNPQHNKLELFKKTQKLLDRFLFIFFAEDRLLLPTNLIFSINLEWQKLREARVPVSLYDRYKMYFDDLNTGARVSLPAFGKHTNEIVTAQYDIYAYNGGLFQTDELLDSIAIDDDLLFKHTRKLSEYDFESEVDVNILGHIFENSLNEIDEIANEIEGTVTEKTKTKRKKDGVFYTPKYITKYIVDNTIGKLCNEKKAELKIIEEEYVFIKTIKTKLKRGEKGFPNERKESLADKLTVYRNWLLELTIVDPACGSGAFLNQALEFLIAEHRYVDELQAKLFGDALVLSDVEGRILENNLYGVDLNEESVEIAKLSLWLRTAQRNRKLNSLNNNIKCGNSLIDDPEVAGDKAFNWQEAFPKVFAKGGFDVVIGNPPYVRVQGLKEHYYNQTLYYETKFQSATGNYDIYALFMEKSFDLIHSKGIVSFILPHKFLVTDFGVGIRKFFVENKAVESLIHFGSDIIFSDAATYTCIVNLTKTEKDRVEFKKIKASELLEPNSWEYMYYKNLTSLNWDLQSEKVFDVIAKLNNQTYKVEDVFDKIFVGLQTSLDEIYVFQGIKEGNVIKGYNAKHDYVFEIEEGLVKPFVKGNQLSRNCSPIVSNYVIFPYQIDMDKAISMSEDFIKEKFPKGYNYIKYFEAEIKNREKGRMNIEKDWYLYIYPKNLTKFHYPKIMTQEISLGCNMTYDEKGEYYHPTTIYSFVKNPKFEVDEKYYLGILNSKVMWFFLKNTGTELGGGYFRFKTNYLKPFPLPEISNNSQVMIDNVNSQLAKNKELQETSQKFQRTLQRKFELEDLPKKLQDWYLLSYAEFIKELAKKKIKLSLAQEAEWEDYFMRERKQALDLKAQIDATDKAIDAMVYELYGLTEEEILIVENS
ncbi:Type I restriction-modification system, DNA-methyltransferase subunit [Flavobacterium limnosediminis JC2902]|uniref:site-specific DNA-methyltransferase (adenine-specific) n=1 Tax=Flavobacterium limnosediminis JC2902 TaxID=1341181 RepID=V6SK34_9FLAO|nr:Type I restriction-modification system, DNA-methyltransferase subunit [Flavobacterium limnosediminis JC2902]